MMGAWVCVPWHMIEDNFMELILSFHFWVGFGDWIWVARLVWQVFLLPEPSHWPQNITLKCQWEMRKKWHKQSKVLTAGCRCGYKDFLFSLFYFSLNLYIFYFIGVWMEPRVFHTLSINFTTESNPWGPVDISPQTEIACICLSTHVKATVTWCHSQELSALGFDTGSLIGICVCWFV